MRTNKIAIALGIAAVAFLGLSILVGGLAMVQTHRSAATSAWQRGYAQPRAGAAGPECPYMDDWEGNACHDAYGIEGGYHGHRGDMPGRMGHMGQNHDDLGWHHQDCPMEGLDYRDEAPGQPGEGYGPRRGSPRYEEGAPSPEWREGMPGRGGGMMGPR